MPAVPMVMPSLMVMVLNSSGVPPAARMPSFTLVARRRRWMLQGPISVQVLAMAISGFSRSSSLRPVALNMARAPARLTPPTSVRLLRFSARPLRADESTMA